MIRWKNSTTNYKFLTDDCPADCEPFAREKLLQQVLSKQEGTRAIGTGSWIESHELADSIKVVGTIATPSKTVRSAI